MTTKRTAAEAMQHIQDGESEAVAHNLGHYEELTTGVAQALIEAGFGHHVAMNISSFQAVDHGLVAEKLIASDLGWYVCHFLDNFQGVDYTLIAQSLLCVTAGGWDVSQHLEAFVRAILAGEPDALSAALPLVRADRLTITYEEFTGLLQVARAVATHRPSARAELS
jgi:hypothetical protein